MACCLRGGRHLSDPESASVRSSGTIDDIGRFGPAIDALRLSEISPAHKEPAAAAVE